MAVEQQVTDGRGPYTPPEKKLSSVICHEGRTKQLTYNELTFIIYLNARQNVPKCVTTRA